MPPIPPPAGMPPPPAFFFGTSATIASVVISSAATEAEFWIATRTTLVGSMMPLATKLRTPQRRARHVQSERRREHRNHRGRLPVCPQLVIQELGILALIKRGVRVLT